MKDKNQCQERRKEGETTNKKICIPCQDVKKSFHKALRRSGINDFHFHDLRHTFASHLVMSGVDLATVSRLLGHPELDNDIEVFPPGPFSPGKSG